jgi:hypothetical protein
MFRFAQHDSSNYNVVLAGKWGGREKDLDCKKVRAANPQPGIVASAPSTTGIG